MKGRADMKNQEKENPYADIINLPRHVSEVYPQMPVANRAAQFSPFAALTGHSAAVREVTPDARKEGGEYVTVSGRLKKIKLYDGALILEDGYSIAFDDIAEISGGVLDEF